MTASQKQTYAQIKDRYGLLRESARDIAYKRLPISLNNKQGALILKNDISFGGFTTNCQKELRKWEQHPSRRVAWEWDAVQKKYRTHPKRFELSIWHRKLFLTGAAIGRPTWGKGKLRLDFIEASPIKSQLSGLIVDLVIFTGEAYADIIGATQIRIMSPVNEDVKRLYLSKDDFSYDKQGDFCYRNL